MPSVCPKDPRTHVILSLSFPIQSDRDDSGFRIVEFHSSTMSTSSHRWQTSSAKEGSDFPEVILSSKCRQRTWIPSTCSSMALVTCPPAIMHKSTFNNSTPPPHNVHGSQRNLYAGQEATVRTGHETIDWLKIGKWVHHCWMYWVGWRTSWNQDCQEKYQ